MSPSELIAEHIRDVVVSEVLKEYVYTALIESSEQVTSINIEFALDSEPDSSITSSQHLSINLTNANDFKFFSYEDVEDINYADPNVIDRLSDIITKSLKRFLSESHNLTKIKES